MFEEGQEILDKRYRVIKKLGSGAFGEIFKGKLALEAHSACFRSNINTFFSFSVEKRKTGEHLAAKVVSE